jgi:hypothetical protein
MASAGTGAHVGIVVHGLLSLELVYSRLSSFAEADDRLEHQLLRLVRSVLSSWIVRESVA